MSFWLNTQATGKKMTFCDLTIPLLDSNRSIKPTVVPIVAYTKIELHKMKIFQFHQEKAFFPLSHTFTPEGCPVQSPVWLEQLGGLCISINSRH